MNNNARAILDALTELIDTLWNVNDIDKYALDFMGE